MSTFDFNSDPPEGVLPDQRKYQNPLVSRYGT